MPVVDLNADVGEWEGPDVPATDAGLMPIITSANIACGGHAGNRASMTVSVALAVAHGVAVGAHPSLDDREHFGRRILPVTPEAVSELIRSQVSALAALAADHGTRLRHVKPHGALYTMVARDARLALALATAVATLDQDLVLFGLSGSELIDAGRRVGLRTASEVFADRGYAADGSLAPRSAPGAVLNDAEVAATRALLMVREQHVVALDGTRVPVRAETICIHSDTPDAVAVARRVRAALESAGIRISACC